MKKSNNINISDVAALLAVLLRGRGIRLDDALQNPALCQGRNAAACSKWLDRWCEKGVLASSALPKGTKLYRLSYLGVRLASAPACWANSPTVGIGAEMIAGSVLGHHEDYLFLTDSELRALLGHLSLESQPGRITGRYLLHSFRKERNSGNLETHIHYLLAELRPADQLKKRVEIIVQNVKRTKVFAELIELGLFGLTIAVPSQAVKNFLDEQPFPVPCSVVVVESLQDLVAW